MENSRTCDSSDKGRVEEFERKLREYDPNIVLLKYLALERNSQGIEYYVFYALDNNGEKFGLVIGDTPDGLQLYKRGLEDRRISV